MPNLDSTISSLRKQLKGCAPRAAGHYCFPKNCGCSSVVEHLLAKEDVASSSLVTRSNPESFRGWSECAIALAEADRPKRPSLGWRLTQTPYKNLRLCWDLYQMGTRHIFAVSPRTAFAASNCQNRFVRVTCSCQIPAL